MTTCLTRSITRPAASLASALALLAALSLAWAVPAFCETITFEGKTECQEAQEVYSPHATDEQVKEARIEAAKNREESRGSSVFEGAITFTKVMVEIGSTVKDNQPLVEFTMPRGVIEFEMNHLETSGTKKVSHRLLAARLELKKKRQELQQAVEDNKKGLVPAAKIEDVRHQVTALEIMVEGLQSYLRGEEDFDDAKYASAADRLGIKSKDPARFPKTGLIRSQVNGQVLWTAPELIQGGSISKRTRLMRIGNLRKLAVQCWVPEKYISQVQPGMPVTVSFESLGGETVKGTVGRLTGGGGIYSGFQFPSIFMVTVDIANDDLRLKEGIRAKVTMEVPG